MKQYAYTLVLYFFYLAIVLFFVFSSQDLADFSAEGAHGL